MFSLYTTPQNDGLFSLIVDDVDTDVLVFLELTKAAPTKAEVHQTLIQDNAS